MQRFPLISVKQPSSLAPELLSVRVKIESLYRDLSDLGPMDEAGANEVIRSIRLLEQRLIDIRKTQPGHNLRM